MKPSIYCSITILAAFLGSSLAHAQAKPVQTTHNAAAQKIIDYWTPERLRDAMPEDLPTISPEKDQVISGEVANPSSGNNSSEAAPPTIDVKPDLTPLFTERLHSKVKAQDGDDDFPPPEPQDVGTANLQFSSSQLVPLAADLAYPYRAVGKLFFTKPTGGNFVCSASVLNNRVIITAGHCVYSAGGYHSNFMFIPSYRSGAAPFQKWAGVFALAAPAWIASPNVANLADQGVIEVSDNTVNGVTVSLASVTGKLGFALNKLTPNHVHMVGYPCNFDNCSIMHQVTAQNGPTVTNSNVRYGSDMAGGSSGSPFVQNFGVAAAGQTGGQNPGRNQIVGILSWGYSDTTIKTQGASPLSTNFTGIYQNICAHRQGNCS